jgi:polysaccharide pyruvyl transferase WcaK-like protein
MIYENVRGLIRYILEDTNLNICFIPHVYVHEEATQDIAVLNRISEEYPNEPRIAFLNQDLSCCEIKYVISHCRFFIGARTHSVIAAYSTGVPTLALSYSIKSLGIAQDIFGSYDGYVLSKEDLAAKDCLKDTFVKNIVQKEEEIKAIYERVLPEYKNSIIDVANEIFASGKSDL